MLLASNAFSQDTFTLNLSALPPQGGTVTADPPPVGGVYNSNTTVTLTATPANSNYVFLFWVGLHPIKTNNPATITMDFNKTAIAAFSNTVTATYTFTEIAFTNTASPGNGPRFTNFGAPIIKGTNVIFHGAKLGGASGLYSWKGSNITTVADTTTTTPTTGGTFSYFFDYDIKFADDGTLLFGATNTAGFWGIYASSNGNLTRVVDSTFSPPGVTNKFVRVRAGTRFNGEAAFVGYRYTGAAFPPSGIYTLKNGNLTKIVDQTSGNLPGGDLPYLTGDTVGVQNGNVAFYAAKGASIFQTAGIYHFSSNNFTLIADTNTIVPGMTNKFSSFTDSVTLENNKVIFTASFPGGNGHFMANADGTGLTSIVDTVTGVVPGTLGGRFSFINEGSYRNGRLAFVASYNNFIGIYLWDHGTITKVISKSDVVKYNHVVYSFSLSSQALQDDGNITFRVTFGFFPPNLYQAIYTTLPGSLPRYSLNASVTPDGAGEIYRYPSIFPAHSIPAGTPITIMALPLGTNPFVQWTGSISSTNNVLDFVMSNNMTLVANFNNVVPTGPTFTLAANVSPINGGTTVLSPPGGTYASNSTVNITATANPGFAFSHWIGTAAKTNSINAKVKANKTFTAVFTNAPILPTYTLTRTASPVSGGTVSVNPPGPTYSSNTLVQATATASPGFKFSHWIGINSPANPVNFAMRSTKTITAVFTNLPYVLLNAQVNPPGAGTISASPHSPSNSYLQGSVVALTAQPDGTNQFAAWIGAGSFSNQVSLTLKANKSVTALFNNPGKFIIYNTNGQLAATFMQNTQRLGSVLLNNGTALPSKWRVVGTGDFDNNGSKDVLIWSTNGQVATMMMQGNIRTATTVWKSMGTAWRVGGVADFNADGKAEVLWQNPTTAKLAIWENNGTTNPVTVVLTNTINPDWRAAAAANFGGSTTPDIVFQNKDGRVALWIMNGLGRSGAAIAPRGTTTPGPGFQVIGATDLDGNGHTDIIFQRADGALRVWYFTGTTFNSSLQLPDYVAAGWKLRAVK